MNRAALLVAIFVACAVICHCQAHVSPEDVNLGVVTTLKDTLQSMKNNTPTGYTLRFFALRFQVSNQKLDYPDPTGFSQVTLTGNIYRWTLTNYLMQLRGKWRTWLTTRPSTSVRTGTFEATLVQINLNATFTHVNGKLRVQSTGGTVGRVAFSTNGWLNFILSWLFKVRTDKALVQEVEKKLCQNLKNILSGN